MKADHPTKAELIGLNKQFCTRCNGAGTAGRDYYSYRECSACGGHGYTLESRLVHLLWSDDLQARVAAGDCVAIELVKLARDVASSITPCEHLIPGSPCDCSPACRALKWAATRLPEDS